MNAQGTLFPRTNGIDTVEEGNGTLRIRRRVIDEVPGCLLFELSGDLHLYNLPFLRRHVEEAVADGFIRLVFDCAMVPHMYSPPIGYLASLGKELHSRGGDFVLARPSRSVQEVLQVLGLARWFTQAESVDEALALLAPADAAGAAGPFPKVFDCPICRKRLRVVREGRYRCRECKTVVVVEASGRFSIR